MLWASDKESLLAALDRVGRIVRANPKSIDPLQCVKVEATSSSVSLTAHSQMASARVVVNNAAVRRSGAIAVNYDRLRDRIGKAGKQVVLQATDDLLGITSSDDQKLGLKLADIREAPQIEWVIPEESYGIDKSDLLALCATASSIASSVSALTPAFLQVLVEDQQMWLATGESYHVLPIQCNPSLRTLIPVSTLGPLAGFVKESQGDRVWLSQGDGDAVVVSVGDDHFQAAPLAVPFPDLSPVFATTSVATTEEMELERTELIKVLQTASTSADKHGRVFLTTGSTGLSLLKVEARSELGDWFEASLKVLWSGEEGRQLCFQLDSLLKYLKSFKSDKIVLQLSKDMKKELSPIYAEEEGHRGIINQFRL